GLLKNPSRIDVKAFPWKFEISDDGDGYSTSEISTLMSQLFMSDNALKDYMGFTVGVVSALETGASSVVVESVKNGEKTFFELLPDYTINDTGKVTINKGTKITVKKNFKFIKQTLKSLKNMSLSPEAKKLHDTCSHISTPLKVNGVKINADFDLGKCLTKTTIPYKNGKIIAGLNTTDSNKLCFYKNGVFYGEPVEFFLNHSMFKFIINNSDFELTLSRNNLNISTGEYILLRNKMDETKTNLLLDYYNILAKKDLRKYGAQTGLDLIKRNVLIELDHLSNSTCYDKNKLEDYNIIRVFYDKPLFETCKNELVSIKDIMDAFKTKGVVYFSDLFRSNNDSNMVINTYYKKYDKKILTKLAKGINIDRIMIDENKRPGASSSCNDFNIKELAPHFTMGFGITSLNNFFFKIRGTDSQTHIKNLSEDFKKQKNNLLTTNNSRTLSDYILKGFKTLSLGALLLSKLSFEYGVKKPAFWSLKKGYDAASFTAEQTKKSLNWSVRNYGDLLLNGWLITVNSCKYTLMGVIGLAIIPFLPAVAGFSALGNTKLVTKIGDVTQKIAMPVAKLFLKRQDRKKNKEQALIDAHLGLDKLITTVFDENKELFSELGITSKIEKVYFNYIPLSKNAKKLFRNKTLLLLQGTNNTVYDVLSFDDSQTYSDGVRFGINEYNPLVEKWVDILKKKDDIKMDFLKDSLLVSLLDATNNNLIRWGNYQPAYSEFIEIHTKEELDKALNDGNNYSVSSGDKPSRGTFGFNYLSEASISRMKKNLPFANKTSVSEYVENKQVSLLKSLREQYVQKLFTLYTTDQPSKNDHDTFKELYKTLDTNEKSSVLKTIMYDLNTIKNPEIDNFLEQQDLALIDEIGRIGLKDSTART
ncbi:MAG: hypothetical protein KKH40_04740, partial [Nanoarchaeota archaeon]|nr:hypothetical protein [Nanoarchaeota archaeon]